MENYRIRLTALTGRTTGKMQNPLDNLKEEGCNKSRGWGKEHLQECISEVGRIYT